MIFDISLKLNIYIYFENIDGVGQNVHYEDLMWNENLCIHTFL